MAGRVIGGSRWRTAARLTIALVALSLTAGATGAAADTRYVTPAGSGAACSPAAPCSIVTGIEGAAFEDEVVIGSGTYSLSTPIDTPTGDLFVHGEPGRPRPVIVSSALQGLVMTGCCERVRDLTVLHTGASVGIQIFSNAAEIDRVQVTSTGTNGACVIGPSTIMRDSLCVATADNSLAIQHQFTLASGISKLRNVTAVATGANSIGMRFAVGPGTVSAIDARDVIAQGSHWDVQSETMGAGSTMSVVLHNSNYDSGAITGAGASLTLPSQNANQNAAPLFSDLSTYRQAPGSPTVDAGTADADTGPTDLDGDPRPSGAAPDIGVDELVPPPADASAPDTVIEQAPKRRTKSRRATFSFSSDEPGATFACELDRMEIAQCPSPFNVRKLKRRGHTFTVRAIDAAGNADQSPAVHPWKVKKRRKK